MSSVVWHKQKQIKMQASISGKHIFFKGAKLLVIYITETYWVGCLQEKPSNSQTGFRENSFCVVVHHNKYTNTQGDISVPTVSPHHRCFQLLENCTHLYPIAVFDCLLGHIGFSGHIFFYSHVNKWIIPSKLKINKKIKGIKQKSTFS